MLLSPLPPSFPHAYSLSISCLWFKAIRTVISFLWFICWSSSLILFMNSLKYLPRRTAHVLCFDLLTRPKMPFKVMHRKEVTHSDGSYERKLRGRKLADEMGRGKKIPLYSHRLTHRKRVTSKLDDGYFRSMTITQAIPKKAEVTHPGRWISEGVAEGCPYHRVGVWR